MSWRSLVTVSLATALLVPLALAPNAAAATLVNPVGGEYFRGTIAIEWVRDEAGTEIKLELYVSGEQIEPKLCDDDCPAGNVFLLDTTQYGDSREYFLKIEEKGIEANGREEVTTSGTFTIDNTVPDSEAVVSGTLGDNGWYVSAVHVQVLADDETSGVDHTDWSLDGSGPAPYVDTVVSTSDGIHTFETAAVDRAGNIEPTESVSFRIDRTAPTSAATIGAPSTDAGRVVYVTSATPISLSGADATSGVDRLEYRLNEDDFQTYDGPFSLSGEDGEYRLEWRAVDAAGNAEETQYKRLVLDDTAPSLDVDRPQPGGLYVDDTVIVESQPLHVEAAGFSVDDDARVQTVPFAAAAGDLTVQAQTSDDASGVDRVEFAVDGVLRATVTEAPYEWTWDTRGEILGEHVVTVTTVDTLGNMASDDRTVEVVPIGPDGVNATVENGGPNVPSFIPTTQLPASAPSWAAWFGLA